MGYLPTADSILIVFFTLFMLTIFQYIFFFSVSSKTFKHVVVNNCSEMLSDKIIFPLKDKILANIGNPTELKEKYIQSVSESDKRNSLIKQKAINYIIYSGLVFFTVFLIGLIYINSKDDPTPILKKMIISMVFVLLGFSTELYLYYLVMLPYRYTSKYELINTITDNIRKKIPNQQNNNKIRECIPAILSNTAGDSCNFSNLIN